MTDVATQIRDRIWTSDEDRANTVTHALGFGGALIGAIVLLLTVSARGSALQLLGCSIYAAALVATYLASTLSHAAVDPVARHRWRIADQALIFLFIASSYTPVACTYLRASSWNWLHLALWGMAIFGFVQKVVFEHRVHLGAVSLWLYLAMGWIPVMAGSAMVHALPAGLLTWMVVGGVCYTVGLVFFYLDHRIPYFHAAWHLWVIAGSACHYFGILLYCTGPLAR